MERFEGIKNRGEGTRNVLHDFLRLFYPRVCVGCVNTLLAGEQWLCTACLRELPQTGHHRWPDNPLWQRFLGRLPLASAQAFLHFRKGNVAQKLLHELKYKGRKELGVFLGRVYGQQLSEQGPPSWQAVVPVPLHATRLRRRGYNQSTYFAQGLSEELALPVLPSVLVRQHATETQTRKDRAHRWENMQHAFEAPRAAELQGKNVLLVDDVVTTGATLEACGHQLLAAGCAQLSIACIAEA